VLLYNAPNVMLDNLKKEILFDSEVVVDGKSKLEANFQEKLEIFLLLQFWSKATHRFSCSL
jgi:hypothetical protein